MKGEIPPPHCTCRTCQYYLALMHVKKFANRAYCLLLQCHVLTEPLHADPEAVVKAFKSGDKYPVYVLRFRMKGGRGAGAGRGSKAAFTLEPVREAPRVGSLAGRSPLTERRHVTGREESQRDLSPPVEKIAKVLAYSVGALYYSILPGIIYFLSGCTGPGTIQSS